MYLAQINIARLLEPLDSPLLADFVSELDQINLLAENSPGFVWRLKEENGNATNIDVFQDATLIVNMSVWESIEHLMAFTYRSGHVEVFKKRAKWFERSNAPHLALWWTTGNPMPDAFEGRDRLLHLRAHGETNHAFSFKKVFPPSI